MHIRKHTTTLLVFTMLISFLQVTIAQRKDRELERDREETKEEPKGIASRLWYGGGINLGFSGYNGGSIFGVGISPMVGYKIVGPLSAGPRVAFVFISEKQAGFKAVGLTNFDLGVFARCRVFQGLFLQAELSNEWYQDLIFREKINAQRVNQRLGAGWNFGQPGGTGSEISLLYNFKIANDINAQENPIEYRLGFTWKF